METLHYLSYYFAHMAEAIGVAPAVLALAITLAIAGLLCLLDRRRHRLNNMRDDHASFIDKDCRENDGN